MSFKCTVRASVFFGIALFSLVLVSFGGCKRVMAPYGAPQKEKALTVDPYEPVRYEHKFNMNKPVGDIPPQ
jgi:hypothetical protein